MEVIRAGISNIGNLFPGSNGSKEVEDEANSYFQRIYNHPPNPTLTIDEVLDLLKRLVHFPHDTTLFFCCHFMFFPLHSTGFKLLPCNVNAMFSIV